MASTDRNTRLAGIREKVDRQSTSEMLGLWVGFTRPQRPVDEVRFASGLVFFLDGCEQFISWFRESFSFAKSGCMPGLDPSHPDYSAYPYPLVAWLQPEIGSQLGWAWFHASDALNELVTARTHHHCGGAAPEDLGLPGPSVTMAAAMGAEIGEAWMDNTSELTAAIRQHLAADMGLADEAHTAAAAEALAAVCRTMPPAIIAVERCADDCSDDHSDEALFRLKLRMDTAIYALSGFVASIAGFASAWEAVMHRYYVLEEER